MPNFFINKKNGKNTDLKSDNILYAIHEKMHSHLLVQVQNFLISEIFS